MHDRWSTAWAFTIAALLIGGAIQLNYGRLGTAAILLVTLALLMTVAGVIGPDWKVIRGRNVVFAVGLAFAVQIGLLLVWPPGAANALQDSGTLVPFRVAMAAIGIIGFSVLMVPARAGWRIAAVIVIYLLAGSWVIALSPNPPNDVWHFQEVAGHALMAGQNPYSIDMPNIYGPHSGLYAVSLERGDVLNVGFPYPPLSLLIAIPGILVGDVRYALLVASAVAVVAIMELRPRPLATGAGLLLLSTPRTFFIVEQAWTEPFVVMFLAIVVLLASRDSRLTPAGLGLLAAVKQHMVLILPIAILMRPRPVHWRSLLRPAGVACGALLIVTVPFAVWDLPAFWHSVVEFQFLQPARADALSYAAWLAPQLPWVGSVAGFVALIPAIGLCIWRSARTPAGFAGAAALMYLAFFALNKQAFANYYYMVIGALCISVAAISEPARGAGVRLSSPPLQEIPGHTTELRPQA